MHAIARRSWARRTVPHSVQEQKVDLATAKGNLLRADVSIDGLATALIQISQAHERVNLIDALMIITAGCVILRPEKFRRIDTRLNAFSRKRRSSQLKV